MQDLAPGETRVRFIVQAIRQLIQGRSNASGTVTLTASTTTTTITDETINGNAGVFFEPTTANAAAEKANGTMHASVAAGQITITHANNAQVDRTFYYLVNGG